MRTNEKLAEQASPSSKIGTSWLRESSVVRSDGLGCTSNPRSLGREPHGYRRAPHVLCEKGNACEPCKRPRMHKHAGLAREDHRYARHAVLNQRCSDPERSIEPEWTRACSKRVPVDFEVIVHARASVSRPLHRNLTFVLTGTFELGLVVGKLRVDLSTFDRGLLMRSLPPLSWSTWRLRSGDDCCPAVRGSCSGLCGPGPAAESRPPAQILQLARGDPEAAPKLQQAAVAASATPPRRAS